MMKRGLTNFDAELDVLSISVAKNFRDVGGQATLDGRHVRHGLVYRSDGIFKPSEADEATLRDRGIAFVCDLRGESEREHAPNYWWRGEGTPILEADILASLPPDRSPWNLLRSDSSEAGARAAMRLVYAALPAAAAPHLGDLFRRIAGGAVPVLIHCTAGKDRTGFVVAVLLATVGMRAVLPRGYYFVVGATGKLECDRYRAARYDGSPIHWASCISRPITRCRPPSPPDAMA